MASQKKGTVAAKTATTLKAPARPRVEAKSTAADVKSYRVTSNLHIDGLKLGPDDEVELTDYQAAGLEGFVEPLVEEPADTDPDAPPAE